nr:immunoglobulin heavy chain junction region [Macaca mulatta]MOV54042.1 immunoglobulin heavy chain junction region [Macaca mulatta]MOV54137.1 immunoglobulin heavy chain junction region [Macaca mulatta]MOV54578.1 immunoglobulin heavy chain junction region [Macaca mulatta]MOV56405.1 immunoglobulin heavy chain junction region [Macaca mulatta]
CTRIFPRATTIFGPPVW